MQKEVNNSSQRSKKILNIKLSLKKIPIISRNTRKIEQIKKANNQQKDQQYSTKNSISQIQSPVFFQKQIKKASLFDQKYEVLQKIGQGANGFVNKCKKIKDGKIYAVKSVMIDEQNILQLKNNFIAVKQLKNDRIVQYKAYYIDMRKKIYYLVMQFVDLPSLDKIKIENQEQLKIIFYQILQTLQYMHQKHICYRDIKPSNILYDQKNKKIKFIDFGTIKKYFRRHSKFDMWTITGTPLYRAPQMFNGGGYDQKIDIWAVGVMLYQFICGKTPFQSPYLSDTIQNIVEKQVQFGSQWQNQSIIIKNLILRMLKKDKNKRLNATKCLEDMWFYSIKFLNLANLSKSYQQLSTFQQRQDNFHMKKIKHNQINKIHKFQTLNYVIEQIDGQDYHHIDSEDQETKIKICSQPDFGEIQKKIYKKKIIHSLIF